MGLDLWFKDDVRRILRSVAAAGDQRGPEYRKALEDVGRAFGLDEAQEVGSPEELLASWRTIDADAQRPLG